ncbi:MAG: gamma-glutamyl-gamma-aminobutyrate hydrolase family protein [Deltaproteobacteria bacterium]|nr:gamma-glutamyl-gamma-aminobutyrate hydrolase family protein [Deltaproteobacteria bacterium]
MANSGRIAIIDLGGQYCHLIARRLRDLMVDSEIFPPTIRAEALAHYSGLILSGGPQSVYDSGAVTIDAQIMRLGIPVLGICYGHQLLATLLGGEVGRHDGEYGFAQLTVSEVALPFAQDGHSTCTYRLSAPHLRFIENQQTIRAASLFQGTPRIQQVWMSHSDAVAIAPPELVTLAATDRCACAAFAHSSKPLFGLQFHPEVVHTEYGARILENFVRSVCLISRGDTPQSRVPALCDRIRRAVADKSVFFLVSGGVDSTVAFVLCGAALPKQRVLGVYVDTGLMRLGETEELRSNLAKLGLSDRIRIWDASEVFVSALAGKIDPEEKRRIIGRLFVEVQARAMHQLGIDPDHWLLGQGTIYPDTIESGGDTGRAALIKTHHNRCEEIRELIRQGKVIEPLAEFYKDEVRELGRELGLSPHLTNRWPFPGPGLAIRCLCTSAEAPMSPLLDDLAARLAHDGVRGVLLPLRSVGVQGDARTYRMLVALEQENHRLDYEILQRLSSTVCNQNPVANRVALLIGGNRSLADARIVPATITRTRLEVLRQADSIARSEVERVNLSDTIWQFPVMLAPIAFQDGESIILRPVNSVDGMTASFANLPAQVLRTITDKILKLPGIDAVFLDITNKPPATIEWE